MISMPQSACLLAGQHSSLTELAWHLPTRKALVHTVLLINNNDTVNYDIICSVFRKFAGTVPYVPYRTEDKPRWRQSDAAVVAEIDHPM